MNRNLKDISFVGIQFILFIAYLFRIPSIDFKIAAWLQYAGLFIAIAGIIAALMSLIALNQNLSVFPTPKKTAALVQTSIYKYIRHPIYTGILCFTFGYAIYSENSLGLIVALLLCILFNRKANYEEQLLQNKFPDYGEYKKSTGMFLPKI